MFLATWCIYGHRRFSKFCNFIFGAKKIGNYIKIYLNPDLVCIDHYPWEISFLHTFPMYSSLLSRKRIKLQSLSHKKKLNSVCTGLEFVLVLLALFAPLGLPSTLLCCHAAVKPTICDMLLNHENFGTDTLLPTPPSESRENSLGSLMHTLFAHCSWCVPCEHSLSTCEFEETSQNSLAAGQHWPSWALDDTFASPKSTFGSPFGNEFWESFGKSLSPAEHWSSWTLTVTFTCPISSTACFSRKFWECSRFSLSPGCTRLSNVWFTIFLDVSSTVAFWLLRDFWESSLYSLVPLSSFGPIIFSTLLCLFIQSDAPPATLSSEFLDCSRESLFCALPFVSTFMISITSALSKGLFFSLASASSKWRSGMSFSASNNFELLP